MELKHFVYIFAVCFMTVLANPPSCNTPADCSNNECCISIVRPIGKRNVDQPKGYCQPLGTEKSGCYVRYGSASHPPEQLVFGCPCRSPLICKGRGVYDVPLGELGYCTDPQ
ncbi:uncharacterized protein LOC134681872 [Mytilus trossulus]|uniref:uncharacterized protein LOC134681872 n=1 Tax=Mytilus trossulus TaxID=6551 RepID=UPI0030043CD9